MSLNHKGKAVAVLERWRTLSHPLVCVARSQPEYPWWACLLRLLGVRLWFLRLAGQDNECHQQNDVHAPAKIAPKLQQQQEHLTLALCGHGRNQQSHVLVTRTRTIGRMECNTWDRFPEVSTPFMRPRTYTCGKEYCAATTLRQSHGLHAGHVHIAH